MLCRRHAVSGQKSTTGISSNLAGLLAYLLGWISGLILFLIEEQDGAVRFHAMQSIIFFGGATVLLLAFRFLQFVPYVGLLFTVLISLLGLLVLVIWVLLMAKAYQGERYPLPVVGRMAARHAARG